MTLSALLIVLFFLPGFIFTLAYYDSKGIPLNVSVSYKVIASLLISLLLHAAGFFILIYCLNQAVDFKLILMLLTNTHNSILSLTLNANNVITLSALYLMCIYFVAFSLGALFRWGIKKCKLDRYKFFRIDSPWYYLFKGSDWKGGQPDGVKIAATIEIAGHGYLYWGVLEDFFLNKEGNIDRLVLAYPSRRHFKNDKGILEEAERFYPIGGDYFVLKYNEIKNLNIEYIDVTKKQGKMTLEYVTPKT